MNLLKFLAPKSVASVCDLDKVLAKLERVADEQLDHASRLGTAVAVLNSKRADAHKEARRARTLIDGINNLLGL